MRQRGHIRRRGPTWFLLYRVTPAPGQRRRLRSVRLGTVRELPTRATARAAADRFLAAADPLALHAGTVVGWEEWCKEYEARHLVLLARGSRETRSSILRRHLLAAPGFAGRKLHEIDPGAAQRFVTDQHRAGVVVATIRTRFALLRRILQTARAVGLACSPPRADAIQFPREETVRPRIVDRAFSPTECSALLNAATDPLLTACYLGRYAGLRCGEILGLTWPCVNLETGLLEIRQQAADGAACPLKSRSSAATLRAPTVLLDQLRSYRAKRRRQRGPWLFADRTGQPLEAAVLRRRLHRLCLELGIPKRGGMHAFRHACAIAMAASGQNPEAIRRAMRHASLRVTAVYLNATEGDVAACLEAGAGNDAKPFSPNARTAADFEAPAQGTPDPREGKCESGLVELPAADQDRAIACPRCRPGKHPELPARPCSQCRQFEVGVQYCFRHSHQCDGDRPIRCADFVAADSPSG